MLGREVSLQVETSQEQNPTLAGANAPPGNQCKRTDQEWQLPAPAGPAQAAGSCRVVHAERFGIP